MTILELESFEWLGRIARSRAQALRSPASEELKMPIKLLTMRQKHKKRIAELFARMGTTLDRGQALADMEAALDLLVYEPNFSSISALTQVENLAIRALGNVGTWNT
jgi:hypothetical protein